MEEKSSDLSTHDKIIKSLEERLENPTREILTKHEFRLIGHEFKKTYRGDHEADILVLDYQKRYAYAIEVKTTRKKGKPKRSNAIDQLEADREYIKSTFEINRVFLFYVYQNKYNKISKKGYETDRIDDDSERRQ